MPLVAEGCLDSTDVTEVELLPLDPGDWLTDADRAALLAALAESEADVAAGRRIDAWPPRARESARVGCIRRRVRIRPLEVGPHGKVIRRLAVDGIHRRQAEQLRNRAAR